MSRRSAVLTPSLIVEKFKLSRPEEAWYLILFGKASMRTSRICWPLEAVAVIGLARSSRHGARVLSFELMSSTWVI